jgi:hypothetical protein
MQRLNQEWQKSLAGTRQTDGKKLGLVWRIRKKISQIIKDYFYLPFFLLIILCHLAQGDHNKNVEHHIAVTVKE